MAKKEKDDKFMLFANVKEHYAKEIAADSYDDTELSLIGNNVFPICFVEEEQEDEDKSVYQVTLEYAKRILRNKEETICNILMVNLKDAYYTGAKSSEMVLGTMYYDDDHSVENKEDEGITVSIQAVDLITHYVSEKPSIYIIEKALINYMEICKNSNFNMLVIRVHDVKCRRYIEELTICASTCCIAEKLDCALVLFDEPKKSGGKHAFQKVDSTLGILEHPRDPETKKKKHKKKKDKGKRKDGLWG